MRNLPDRVWKLPRNEGDEAAEEGIGRILALSDGVFAIAMTLLILDIAVPAATSDTHCGSSYSPLPGSHTSGSLARNASGLKPASKIAITRWMSLCGPFCQ